MLKGVSQKVIEVVRTDNRYFEKAILFLRPTAPEEDKNKLKDRAWEYLGQIDYHPNGKKSKPALRETVKLLGAALGGAVIACFFLLL